MGIDKYKHISYYKHVQLFETKWEYNKQKLEKDQ